MSTRYRALDLILDARAVERRHERRPEQWHASSGRTHAGSGRVGRVLRTRASNYISISAAPPVEGCGAAGLRSRAQP